MKILRIISLVLITVLGLASGIAKVMQMPDDKAFFLGAGLTIELLILLGAIQLLSAALLMPAKTRRVGAALMAVSFLISTVVIVINGQMTFAVLSCVPIALAALLIWQPTDSRLEKLPAQG